MAEARPATIVIGTDLSDASRPAWGAARGLAHDLGARLVLVHAFEQLPAGTGIAGEQVQRDIQMAHQLDEVAEGQRLSEDWAQEARGEGLDVGTVAKDAPPADVILEAARQHDAFMVVVGTHGRGAIKRMLMGSVAQEIVRKSDRPVLVVPSK